MMKATTISYPFLAALLTLLMFTPNLYAQDFVQLAKIVEPQREMDNSFGQYIAMDGHFAVVGVPRVEEDENGNNPMTYAGAAYVYQRDGANNWTLVQKLVASDRNPLDSFGISVAISGTSMLIGASGDGEGAIEWAGAVYAFERNANGLWEETQKLVTENRRLNDRFGFNIAMKGNRAAMYVTDQQDPLEYAGSVYVFEKDGTGLWHEVQRVVANDRDVEDRFGTALAIEEDILVVGAR